MYTEYWIHLYIEACDTWGGEEEVKACDKRRSCMGGVHLYMRHLRKRRGGVILIIAIYISLPSPYI